MTAQTATPRWASVREAADILGLEIKTVYKAVRLGELPSRRICGRILIPLSALLPDGEAAAGICFDVEPSET